MNIAIFGSAFNPPTLGHADVINQLLNHELAFDKILLVPAFKHAFNKQMMNYETRVSLLKLFTKDIANSNVESFDVEHLIQQPNKPVYTFDLLEYVERECFPSASLSFVIGPDNQRNWHKFYRSEEILKRWNLVHVDERTTVRSTLVRQLLADNQNVSHLVTKSVNNYLLKNRDILVELGS